MSLTLQGSTALGCCGLGFLTLEALNEHLATHGKNIQLIKYPGCDLCSKVYSSKEKLLAHTLRKHRATTVIVEVPKASEPTPQEDSAQLQGLQKKKALDPIRTTPKRPRLNQMRRKDNPKQERSGPSAVPCIETSRNRCQTCDCFFTRKSALLSHLKSISHLRKMAAAQKTSAREVSPVPREPDAGPEAETDELPPQLTPYDYHGPNGIEKTSAEPLQLNENTEGGPAIQLMAAAPSPDPITTKACSLCKDVFPFKKQADKKAFHEHMEMHEGLRPYFCSRCKPMRGFSNPMTLMLHTTKMHDGESRFDCEFCKGKFMTKTELNHHSKKCKA